MPLLTWINDKRARSAATEVPFHLLKKISSYGDEKAVKENLLIQGDNLLALKALLPLYRGGVKCIYIDPPYNTGSAFEHYDDHLEHSQWLSMMYPRLVLLREFLCETGTIWITLDDREVHYAKVICDEIFDRKCFVSSVIWKSSDNSNNDEKKISTDHNEILVYSKSEGWISNKLNDPNKRAHFKNPDNDPNGPYFDGNPLNSPNYRENLIYDIVAPNGNIIKPPKNGWRWSKETLKDKLQSGEIRFNNSMNGIFRRTYLKDMAGLPPSSLWVDHEETGHNRRAATEQKQLIKDSGQTPFKTPKPETLIKRIIEISTSQGDLVLDSFLGSGTTAAVAHKMRRKYIGVELGEHARTHCLPRLEKVIQGERGGVSAVVGWTGGGGFSFYELGPKVFDQFGSINTNVDFETLAAYIWQKETNTVTVPSKSPYLGTTDEVSIFLLYNGVLGDKKPEAGNVLTPKILRILEKEYPISRQKIIYGEAVIGLSETELNKKGITFKQIPYDITE